MGSLNHQLEAKDIGLRTPEVVMDLKRLGSFYPYKLSFMRKLIRKVMTEKWDISLTLFNIDKASKQESSTLYSFTERETSLLTLFVWLSNICWTSSYENLWSEYITVLPDHSFFIFPFMSMLKTAEKVYFSSLGFK